MKIQLPTRLFHTSAKKKGNALKFVRRILENLEPRHHKSSSEPQPRRVAWPNIFEACVKMRFFGCSTAGDERKHSTDSFGITDAEPPPRLASHSRTLSVWRNPYVRQCQKCQKGIQGACGTFGTPSVSVFDELHTLLCSTPEKLTDRFNSPVQGNAADGLKLALALLWERRGECPRAVPVLVCQDEVVVECDEDRGEETKRWLEEAMVERMEECELGYACSFIRARFM